MVCANTSDAITEAYNRTKDLFTQRCSFIAIVLGYDVTIKVLGFLIESWLGCVCMCVGVGVWVRYVETGSEQAQYLMLTYS